MCTFHTKIFIGFYELGFSDSLSSKKNLVLKQIAKSYLGVTALNFIKLFSRTILLFVGLLPNFKSTTKSSSAKTSFPNGVRYRSRGVPLYNDCTFVSKNLGILLPYVSYKTELWQLVLCLCDNSMLCILRNMSGLAKQYGDIDAIWASTCIHRKCV